MADTSSQATLLAVEAAVLALIKHAPKQAKDDFLAIFTAEVRSLNKAGNPELAQELAKEGNRIAMHFPSS